MDRHSHHTLTAVFERCDEGGFHTFIKEIPGVHSESDTIEESSIDWASTIQWNLGVFNSALTFGVGLLVANTLWRVNGETAARWSASIPS
jgi:hypothetical protein